MSRSLQRQIREFLGACMPAAGSLSRHGAMLVVAMLLACGIALAFTLMEG